MFSGSPLETNVSHEVTSAAITRMKFKHFWWALLAWIEFRRLYQRARHHPGFIRGQAALADPRTIINVSIWRSDRDMRNWSGNEEHVRAVRWTYGRVREVWSAEWHHAHSSGSARNWDGVWAPLDGRS